jgi:hypothetical protein
LTPTHESTFFGRGLIKWLKSIQLKYIRKSIRGLILSQSYRILMGSDMLRFTLIPSTLSIKKEVNKSHRSSTKGKTLLKSFITTKRKTKFSLFQIWVWKCGNYKRTQLLFLMSLHKNTNCKSFSLMKTISLTP